MLAAPPPRTSLSARRARGPRFVVRPVICPRLPPSVVNECSVRRQQHFYDSGARPTWPAPWLPFPAMTESDFEFASRHAPICLDVALARRIDNAGGQGWWRGVAVPPAGVALGVEIVAQRLLVEARLRLAGFVDVDRPEPRAVRRHHLVDQDDASIPVAAEFEFGVGDDD